MTVTGINSNYYLINNPIWVYVGGFDLFTTPTKLIQFKFKDVNSAENIYNLERSVFKQKPFYIDISNVLKAMMPFPKFKNGLRATQDSNIRTVEITFDQLDENGGLISQNVIQRSFIRGGAYNGHNVHLVNDQILTPDAAFPVWTNFPAYQYNINLTKIDFYLAATVGNTRVKNMPVIGCDPMYVAFLNSMGGYSFWLFESWDISEATGSAELTTDRFRFNSFGAENTHKINANSVVPKDFYRTMLELAKSPEVYIYKLEDKMNISGYNISFADPNDVAESSEWQQVHNNGNSFKFNANQKYQNVSMSFQGKFTENTNIISRF